MKNFNTNRLLKPSVGRHIALLSRAQNSCLWRHNVKLKVSTVFIAGILKLSSKDIMSKAVHVQKSSSQNIYSLSKTMKCGILTLWCQSVTMLLYRGRKYGVSLSHEPSDFLIYFYGHESKNRYKKYHFWNPKQMYFNVPKIIFEVHVPFKQTCLN